MNRRDFVRLGCATVIAAGACKLRPAWAQPLTPRPVPSPPQRPMAALLEPNATDGATDFTLQIAPMTVELAPQVVISTIGYSNKVPGPLLRVREGQRVAVEVVNDTDVPEYVHWHGLLIPSDVDGAEEEGTPPVPRMAAGAIDSSLNRRVRAGTTRTPTAMMDLHRGAYTGQFGFLMIDSANDPGGYDQEVFLALREWQPYLTTVDPDEEQPDPTAPMPEKPAKPDPRPDGLEVSAPLYSINDKVLGAGEPLRVRPGQRILMHLLNASASQIHRVALPGHKFQVIALDGNPVPAPQLVGVIEIAPGERVDAIVEMNEPGVWILGEVRDVARQSGMGIVVEYANQQQQRAIWLPPPNARWDYTQSSASPLFIPRQTRPSTWSSKKCRAGPMGSITGSSMARNIRTNGNSFSGREAATGWCFTIAVTTAIRCISTGTCSSLSRSTASRPAGIMKDTVIVPEFGRAAVDLVADQPGLTLFHCHIQQHMDFGFKALFRYA